MSGEHELVRTFHSTCVVTNYDVTLDQLQRVIGVRVLEYAASEANGIRGGTNWVGDNCLEIVQPIVTGHATDRFLKRFGAGLHSCAFQVADLDATIAHLAEGGVKVAGRPDSRFCFTDPRTTGGLLFEWANFTIPGDPRLGHPLEPDATNPLLQVTLHAFLGAVVTDPLAWAETFGPLFGLREAFRSPHAPPGQPVVGLLAPDYVLALYALSAEHDDGLWDRHHQQSRFHVLGLAVPNLDDAAAALSSQGIALVRSNDDQLLVDPRCTGEVPLVLVDQRLPGDLR